MPHIDTQHTDLHQLLLTKNGQVIRFSLPEALTRFLKAKLRVMQEEIDRLCQELTTKVTCLTSRFFMFHQKILKIVHAPLRISDWLKKKPL